MNHLNEMKPETDRLTDWKGRLRISEPPQGYAEKLETQVMNRIHQQSEKPQSVNRWGIGVVVISWISAAAACLFFTFTFSGNVGSGQASNDWAEVEAELARASEIEIQEWLADAGTMDKTNWETEMEIEWQESDILE